MRKGIARIISGIVLICFQLMSVFGLMKSGMPLPTIRSSGFAFWYDLISLLSYYLIGIVGMISLISGFFACTKYQSPTLIRYNLRKVFNAAILRQVIPFAIISILVIVSFVQTSHLSSQVEHLSIQLKTLESQNETLSQSCKDIESALDESVRKTKELETDINDLSNRTTRKMSQLISNAVIAYHAIDRHSSNGSCHKCITFRTFLQNRMGSNHP